MEILEKLNLSQEELLDVVHNIAWFLDANEESLEAIAAAFENLDDRIMEEYEG